MFHVGTTHNQNMWTLLVFYLTLGAFRGFSEATISPATLDIQPWDDRRDLTSPPLPRGFLSSNQLIEREGYRSESYRVTTEDGYQLKLTRIVTGRGKPGIPVFLQHGIIVCSENFISRGKDKDLAFILADMGYDVWLGDQRGDYYSRKHIKYTPREARFWDFSIHECGYYDIPAFIDAVTQITGYPKIYYIGHSMGTTVFLIMASSRPEYNDKILAAVLLAPVGYAYPLSAVANPLNRLVLVQYDGLNRALDSGRLHEFMPRSPRIIKYIKQTCSRPPGLDYCLDFAGSFYGEHRHNLDKTMFADLLKYTPAGTSAKTVHHFTQIFKKGFRRYDYGPAGNMRHYNSTTPPEYDVSKISAAIAIFYGINDSLTYTDGILSLASKLPNAALVREVPDIKYTHIDFLFGNNAKEMVYDELIAFLQRYPPS